MANREFVSLIDMDGLIKLLPAILQTAGGSDQVAEAACLAAWRHAAGEGLRDHAVAMRRSQKTLVVSVADTTWQKQLQSLSGQLLFRLNSILGQPLVTFIDFRVDPQALSDARVSMAQVSVSDVRVSKVPKQADDQGTDPNSISVELVAAAARIQDKDLRRAFLGASISCLKRLDRSRISDLRSQI